jgi:hypothetical protein
MDNDVPLSDSARLEEEEAFVVVMFGGISKLVTGRCWFWGFRGGAAAGFLNCRVDAPAL